MPDRTLRYVTTFQDQGVAAGLQQTASVGEKTASRIGSAFSQLGGQIGGELGGALEKIGAGITNLGEQGSDAGKKLATFGVATAAVGIALTALGANGKRATDQLKVAIEDSGHSFSDYSDQIDKTVKQQENFGHTAEDTKNALQKLVQATQDPTKALQLMGLTADIAAARHIDLVDAATLVAKVVGGSAGKVLASYGITMQKNADGTKNVDLALQQLAARVQGQASASVDNFSGKVDVVLTKLQDWATEIGQTIGPALSYLGGAIAAAGKVWQFFQERSAAAAAANAAVAASSTETADIVIASSAQMDEAIGSIGATSRITAAQYVAASAAIEASSVEMAATAEGSAAAFDSAMASQAAAAKATAAANAEANASLLLLTGGLGLAAAAVAALAVGAVVLVKALGDAGRDAVTGTSAGIKELTKSLTESGGTFDTNTQKILANTLAQGGFIEKAAKAGVTTKELVNGIAGTDDAMKNLIATWKANGKPSEETIILANRLHKAFQDQAAAGQKSADVQKQVADAVTGTGQALSAEDQFLKDNNLTVDKAAQKYKDAKTQAYSFTSQLGYMSKALDTLSGNQINSELGALKLKDSFAGLTDQVKQNVDKFNDHGTSLSRDTVEGRINREWALQQIQAINQQAIQYATSTGSIKKGTDSLDTNTDALRKSMYQAGFTKDEVNKLIDRYKATPGEVLTSIRQQGQQAVIDALGGLEYWLHRIADRNWAANIDIIAGAHAAQGGHPAATGGLLMGPGGPTSDNLLIAASPGEYVVNAAAAAQNLPLLDYINENNNRIKAYAAGGLVGHLNFSEAAAIHVNIAAAEQQARDAARASFGGAGVPGNFSGSLLSWVFGAEDATGTPASWTAAILRRIMFESGGNPNAINLWDSNAAAGDPSRGLMQTIGSTFNAYHQAGTSGNIYDPVANIAAAINYIKSRYGSIFAIDPPVQGYGDGGVVDRTGLAYLHRGETVTPAGRPAVVELGPRSLQALAEQIMIMDGEKVARVVTKRQTDYAQRGGRR